MEALVIAPAHSSTLPNHARRTPGALALLAALALLCARAPAQVAKPDPPLQVGAQPVTVHTAFGGFILGYDIDQAGREGVLAEALTLPNGHHDVAVETFDQRTGKITHIVVQE